MTASFSFEERVNWWQLIRTPNVGPVTFYRLLEAYGSVAAALEALPAHAARGGKRDFTPYSRRKAEREVRAAEADGLHVLCRDAPEYPFLLRAVEDAPPVLFVLGAPDILTSPAVALVGTRNASAAARRFARRIARDLAESGLTVISGMARGVDTAAHAGALETRSASPTVAVLAGGVRNIYPPENRELHARIVARGAVVSEMPPEAVPRARHFPRRNRIISGLARATAVVEAGERSGSLITARLAAEQGREVFAAPSAPGESRGRGSNRLLREGAGLMESAEDILNALPPVDKVPDLSLRQEPSLQKDLFCPPPEREESAPPERKENAPGVADLIGLEPVTVDELVRECQLSLPTVSAEILDLELAGRLRRLPGGRVVADTPGE